MLMSTTALKIRLFPDPALRKKARRVLQVTPTHRRILSDMAELMYAASGIGLAASQVGINDSLIVVDIGSGLYKLVNPKIIKKKGRQVMKEGCLSLPGICISVKRARKVWVAAQDEFGRPAFVEAEGLLASVFQHEIEHLKGRLIIDYARLFEKLKLKKRLAELKRRTKDEALPESKTKSCQLQL